MKKVSGLNVLNDIQENHKMVSKLPKWLSTRSARVVYKSKEEKKGFAAFSEFVDFLVTESNIACDPVNVKFNRNNEENKRSKDTRKPDPPHPKYTSRPSLGGLRTFATKSENNNPEIPATNSCQLCKANRHLDACERFCEMGIKERKKFTQDKGLCFSCLEQGHLSKQCKKRRKCDTCGKLHPTSLHGDLKENANDENANNPSREETANFTTVNCTKACFMNDGSQMRISSMIVPVWVYHSDDPENKNLTYALLDDQSDTTFVTQKTLNSLNVSGPETTLSLSTMHADRQAIESTKIKGLVVCDYNYNVSIPLPVSFSCAVILAKRTQIPCPEMVTQWPHLTPIATSLAPYHTTSTWDFLSVQTVPGLSCHERSSQVETTNHTHRKQNWVGASSVTSQGPDEISRKTNGNPHMLHIEQSHALPATLMCLIRRRATSPSGQLRRSW